jgi:hypothetical protein
MAGPFLNKDRASAVNAGSSSSRSPSDNDYSKNQWWHKSKAQAPSAMLAQIQNVLMQQRGVQIRTLRACQLYGGYGYLTSGRFASAVAPKGSTRGGVAAAQGRVGPHYNLIQAACATVQARQLSNGWPHVTALTNDGDFELQHKAALLDQFNEGLEYQTDADAEDTRTLLDCLAIGTGINKTDHDADNNVRSRRTFPLEVWHEMWDARDQRPRVTYQITTEDRDELAAKYPGKKSQIMNMKPQYPLDQGSASDLNTNSIAVWYGWVAPVPGEGQEGRFLAVLGDDTVLEDKPWMRKAPFRYLRYVDGLTGMLGIGIADLGYGHQQALNSICRAEYMAHSQMSLPRLFARIGSKLNINHLLSSRSGLVLEALEPPQVLNFPATTEDFVAWKQWVITSFYEFLRISQMAASGQLPPGLKSGAAIRDYMQQQDIGFAVLGQRVGRYRVECAEDRIAEAKEVYEETGAFDAKVIGKKFIETIPWKDIDLAEEEYRLKLYETSALPRTPAGRLAFVQELMQANLITPDVGRKLLQMPDLDDELGLANAAEENAKMTAFVLLHGKEADPIPIPDGDLQNLALCIATVKTEALKAINNKAPVWRVNRCRTWLQNALTPAIQANAQQMTGAMGAPPPPQALPEKPPQSELLPNQPEAQPQAQAA